MISDNSLPFRYVFISDEFRFEFKCEEWSAKTEFATVPSIQSCLCASCGESSEEC